MPPTHPLFDRFPPQSDQPTTLGPMPAPYTIHDGYGLLIAGTMNASIAVEMLAREDVEPVMTGEGRVLAGLWACDFTQATMGPHLELQFFIAVSPRPWRPVSAHPLILLRLLLAEPELGLFCHRVWNNSERVVAYNRELLGLDARLARGVVEQEEGAVRFRFRAAEGDPLVEGRAGRAARTPAGVMWQAFRVLGPNLARRAAPGRVLESRIINPKGIALTENHAARAYLAADRIVVQRWNPAADRLAWSAEPYADGDFRPTFIEHFAPYRFVYTLPIN